MRSRLPALVALVAILITSTALAADPEPSDAPMSVAEVRALQARLDAASARMTRELEARIERQAERWVIARISSIARPAPPAARAPYGPSPSSRVRRSPEGCEFEADGVLSCRVLGSW